jgi:hypothetical protein
MAARPHNSLYTLSARDFSKFRDENGKIIFSSLYTNANKFYPDMESSTTQSVILAQLVKPGMGAFIMGLNSKDVKKEDRSIFMMRGML